LACVCPKNQCDNVRPKLSYGILTFFLGAIYYFPIPCEVLLQLQQIYFTTLKMLPVVANAPGSRYTSSATYAGDHSSRHGGACPKSKPIQNKVFS
jgi:hypothetical protein